MLKLIWERWKKVPELENVKVSNLGNVKINGKAVRPKVSDKGYFVIECEDKYFFVHRLVAKAFLKHNLEKYDTIDHIDQNKRNNALSNLEIVPHEENLRRAVLNQVQLPIAEVDFPDWKIRLADGKHEYRSLKRAVNSLVNETNLTREEAIQDIMGCLVFGFKGERKWEFAKEEK